MSSRAISDGEVVAVAVEMGWSVNPFSDLVSAVRQKFRISPKRAGGLVGRVLDLKLIRQEWSERWVYGPTQAGNASSDPCWRNWGAKWV